MLKNSQSLYLYVIRCKKRDENKEYLQKNNIQCIKAIHYPIPVHKQKAYLNLGNSNIPITELICNEIISLPMNPWLNGYEIEKVCEIMNDGVNL